MMYPYMTLWDDTKICHSQILEKDGKQSVEVHFERPTDSGFCTARCSLPEYCWTINEGFSDDEIAFFEEFLHHNAHLIFKYASSGGVHCA